MTANNFFQNLMGTSGRYLLGACDPHEALSEFFQIYVSCKVAKQIINGHKRLSATYAKEYLGEGGLQKLENVFRGFLECYHSTTLLQTISAQIHMNVTASNWSQEQLNILNAMFTPNMTRSEMAVYFARVLHCIFCN